MQLYFIRHAQSANNVLWDVTGSARGRSEDPEITDLGRKQARLLAQFIASTEPAPVISAAHLDAGDRPTNPDKEGEEPTFNKRDFHNHRGFGLTHVYTSLMLRAIQTGEPLARALDLPLLGWLDLHETGGIYVDDETADEQAGDPLRIGLPGKSRSYLEQRFPNLRLHPDLDESGWWNRPFEERPQRFERARRFITDLLVRHNGTGDRVAVISHGAFYNYFIHTLLNICPNDGGEFSVWFTMNNCAISRFDFLDDELSIVYQNRADFLPADLIT